MIEGVTVARAKPKPEPRPEPRTIGFRVSPEYAEWVDRLASRNRTTISGLIDQALMRYAKSIDFEESPPER